MTEKQVNTIIEKTFDLLGWILFVGMMLILLSCSDEEIHPLAGTTWTAGYRFNDDMSQSYEFIDDWRCQHYHTWMGTTYNVEACTYKMVGSQVVILRQAQDDTPLDPPGGGKWYTLSGELLISQTEMDVVLNSPVTYKRALKSYEL